MVMATNDTSNLNGDDLILQVIEGCGISPVYVQASYNGNYFFNSKGKTFLVVKNSNDYEIEVFFESRVLCNHGRTHNEKVMIPGQSERWLGMFSPSRFNDVNGKAFVYYSTTDRVMVAAVTIGGEIFSEEQSLYSC